MTARHGRRLYRGLLRLGPRSLRQRYADDMEELFLARLAEARCRGRLAAAAAWGAAAADIVGARLRYALRTRDVPHLEQERRAFMLGSDLRYTMRWLGRQRFSTALVTGMLSLGIAASIVVFSLVNALFLRPFPFDDPERLVYINETAPKWNLEIVGITYPDFDHWRRENKVFEAVAMWNEDNFNLSDASGAERIAGGSVTHDFPDVLRVRPIVGRMFNAEEDTPNGPRVVVLSEGLWRERFGGREDALGQTLRLNSTPHAIVGVIPNVAMFPGEMRLWVPFRGNPARAGSYGSQGAIGRLKPGLTAADAEKDLLRTQQAIWDARDRDRVVSPFVRTLRGQYARDFRTQSATLLIAVGILLVVACANVASVMLARALARRREMGIRLAVGASRGRIARQLFLENVLIAAAGGAIGLMAGRWALQLLLTTAGDQVPRWANFGLDIRVVGFAVLMSVLTTILFGWAPALHAIRGNVRGAMQETSGGSTGGPGGRRTLAALVTAEFALATILLVCGGLLYRAYDRVRHVDPGFRVENVLTFSVALPGDFGDNDESRAKLYAFWTRLVQRFEALPGVDGVGLVNCAPLGCHWGSFYRVEGAPPRKPGEPTPVTLYRPASPGYFKTMGIRLKSGRLFTDDDGRPGGGRVVIVNETFARTFWPGVADPVGRRLRGMGDTAPWMTVVGFVQDIKHYGLEQPMRPGLYLPLQQSPPSTLVVAVRTAMDPAAFAGTARAALRALNPDLPLIGLRTMEQTLQRSLAQRTLYSWLLAVFAAMALMLALGGTYGVTAYLVSQRTREIGIRVALGARRADITRTVLRTSLSIVGAGVIAGLAAAVAVARLLAEMLFGVPPHDGWILAYAAGGLIAMAAAVNWPTARRAARLDPVTALRAGEG
jgi:predicted permease